MRMPTPARGMNRIVEQAREIQERFQQYQRAMQRYDSSLHQANAQASAVVSRLQDTDDAAASLEWDDEMILNGSSSPSGEELITCALSLALRQPE